MDIETLCQKLKIETHTAELKAWLDGEKNSIRASITAEKDQEMKDYVAKVEAAKAAIVAAAVNPEIDTVSAIAAIISEAEKTDIQKRKEALAAEIAEKQAELQALQ